MRREQRARMLWVLGCLAAVTAAPALAADNELWLTVATGSECAAPDDQVTVTLDVANLTCAINGVQALIHYNTTYLSLVSITPTSPWSEVELTHVGGDVVYAVAINTGPPPGSMSADGTVATLVFDVVNTGSTTVTFQADGSVKKTKLTCASDNSTILPTKVSSGTITLAACEIGGFCYNSGQQNSGNDCEVCNPSGAGGRTDWSPRASGAACGSPPDACEAQDTCNGSGSCVDNGYLPDTTECRAAVGDCDVAEKCTGSAAACPVDGYKPSGAACGSPPDACEAQDTCNGSGSCVDNGYLPVLTECRAAVGECDVAESCTGTSAACPVDGVATVGTVCRAAAGQCDIAEQCDGASKLCPTDAFEPITTVCRAAAGQCDVAENCTGTAAACPADVKSTAVCRVSAGDCDVAESCDGASNNCPADTFLPDTTECRAAVGDCDVAEKCTGSAAACPVDGYKPSGAACGSPPDACEAQDTCNGSGSCVDNGYLPVLTECRAAVGECDVAESCTGTSAACPVDGVATVGTVCRAAAGQCDIAEQCDGASKLCPTDAFEPITTVCRAAAGQCDVAENCTGTAAACPADVKSTAVCRVSAGDCDVAESCDGASNNCPADTFLPDTTECRAAVGDCDVAEKCTGSAAACPVDGYKPSGAACGDPDGTGCNAPDSCDGSGACVNRFKPDTTVCRSAAGDCDVAENCTGSSAVCPTDAFKASNVVCRAAAGQCDVVENCTGLAAVCPTDAKSTAECRASVGDCDVAETCDGVSNDCPSDVSDTRHVTVTIAAEALGVGTTVTRDVTFKVTECGHPVVTHTEPVTFNDGVATGVTLDLTDVSNLKSAESLQVTEGHTLSRRVAIDLSSSCEAVVTLTGDSKLTAGDFHTASVNQDNLIDIVDFSILASRWDTPCSDCTAGLPKNCSMGADATGDGAQGAADFTAIQINFFKVGDAVSDCPLLLGGPKAPDLESDIIAEAELLNADASAVPTSTRARASLLVSELSAANASLARADLNGDGRVDAADIRAFARRENITLLPEFNAKLQQLEAQPGGSVVPVPDPVVHPRSAAGTQP